MAFEYITYEKAGHLVCITINRPDSMNSLHPPAHLELTQAFDDFSQDDDAWVAIYTGAGDKAFSAGNDLKWTVEHGFEAVKEALLSENAIKGGFGGITTRYDCFKPIIAAVNGVALGGGFEIVLACDIVIAARKLQFEKKVKSVWIIDVDAHKGDGTAALAQGHVQYCHCEE